MYKQTRLRLYSHANGSVRLYEEQLYFKRNAKFIIRLQQA